MRIVENTTQFKKDFRREIKGKYRSVLESDEFKDVLNSLMTDTPLDSQYGDHPLSGNWKDCRDCHIRPDLVLIYRKIGAETLQLVRIGSHSELGL